MRDIRQSNFITEKTFLLGKNSFFKMGCPSPDSSGYPFLLLRKSPSTALGVTKSKKDSSELLRQFGLQPRVRD